MGFYIPDFRSAFRSRLIWLPTFKIKGISWEKRHLEEAAQEERLRSSAEIAARRVKTRAASLVADFKQMSGLKKSITAVAFVE